jgi:hypothetical protein
MSSSFATCFISSVAIPLLALLIWVPISNSTAASSERTHKNIS